MGMVINEFDRTLDIENGDSVNYSTYFYIVPSNLNCYPVWDARLKKKTNGCNNNEAFDARLPDGSYAQTFTWTRSEPFVDPFVEEYDADPTDPKWVEWKYEGGGVLDETGEPVDAPGNPVRWKPFNRNDHINTETFLRVKLVVDATTGFVEISLTGLYLEFEQDYQIPITCEVKNGNGSSTKVVTIHFSTSKTTYLNNIPFIEDMQITEL